MYSVVPLGAQIQFGLQNLFPSTLWTPQMAILGAFLKIEMPTVMGCYDLFFKCIELNVLQYQKRRV